jgi:hypothetical protein
VLRPGGRLAIADIVTELRLTEAIVSNDNLWASCIGGATQQDSYRHAIEAAGMPIKVIRCNGYEFISDQARNAIKPTQQRRLWTVENATVMPTCVFGQDASEPIVAVL